MDATVGWTTADASRKPVPAQKACSAVPPSSALMMGSAAGRLVDSTATADTMICSDRNASRNRFVGRHASAAGLGSGRDVSPPARGGGGGNVVVGPVVASGVSGAWNAGPWA